MIEIRPFEGSAEELAAFTNRVWRAHYEGRMPMPLWTAQHFERDLLADGRDRDLIIAAYDGARLVGVHPAKSLKVRLHGQVLPATWASFLSVDPHYRREGVALKLQSEFLRRHQERGLRLNLGFNYFRSPVSAGPAFWRRQGVRLVSHLGLWARTLDYRAVARFETYRREVLMCRLVGPLLPRPWLRPELSAAVRTYRPTDLGDCLALVDAAGDGADLAYVWDDATLARQLDFPGVSRTVVLARGGHVRGLVNYTLLEHAGRCVMPLARIDLMALAGLGRKDQGRLLDAALRQMVADGAKAVVMVRDSWRHWRVLLRSGFVPLAPEMDLVALMVGEPTPLGRVRRLQVVWR